MSHDEPGGTWGILPDIDMSRAHPGRVYARFLGSKDNYIADREAADALEAALSDVPRMARANRDFMLRAVRRLVDAHGIRQLIDIGSGFPVSPNLHEVAQDVDPSARVVYVDNDVLVGTHSRALLTSTREGRVEFLLGDATNPAAILASSTLSRTLDLSEPVALMLVSVLMYFDDDTVHRIVDTLMDALPSGSYLTISHPTGDFAPDIIAKAAEVGRAAGLTYIARTRHDVEKLFSGVELCDPGVVAMPHWHPMSVDIADDPHSLAASTHYWVGMGRKP